MSEQMIQYTEQSVASLEHIKENFDSAYSYIIFEKSSSNIANDGFEDIIDALSASHEKKINYRMVENKENNRRFLVVKMSPYKKEEFLNSILLLSLSKNINLFMYDPP
jgi:hypothetical protein